MWTMTLHGLDDQHRAIRMRPRGVRTLGRAPQADFVVDAPLVSRTHCRFLVDRDGRLEVEDLESRNGTFVNERRVQRAFLVPGDRVRIGRVELRVTLDGSPHPDDQDAFDGAIEDADEEGELEGVEP